LIAIPATPSTPHRSFCMAVLIPQALRPVKVRPVLDS